MRALEFFRNTLPRHQRELKLRRQFSARSSDAVEAVDLQPLSREAAPKMLRMLELGMRKAGAGAAGLADSPLARGPDDRETRFGTRSEWADFADFAKERKGKDHAYERAKAEKAMAESGDGWRPGAHDEALDSLLDRFDDDDDPIVMRELAPTPEVTFDVADMPEAPPDGRPLLFVGPPPGGRPLGRRAAGHVRRAARRDRRRARGAVLPDALSLKTGHDGVAAPRADELADVVRRRARGRGQAADSHQGDDARRLAKTGGPRFEGAREHARKHVFESRLTPVEEGGGGRSVMPLLNPSTTTRSAPRPA